MSGPAGAEDAAPRVTDGALDPTPLVRTSGDAASGALVVLSAAAAEGPTPRGGAAAGAASGEGAEPRHAATGLEEAVRAVERRALERFDVRHCRIQLRPSASGEERAVLTVVRAPHRGAAFDAARWATVSLLDRWAGEVDAGAPEPSGEAPGPDG